MVFIVILVLGSLLVVDQLDVGWILLRGPSGAFAVFFSFLALVLIVGRLAYFRASERLDHPARALPELQTLYNRSQRTLLALAAGGHFTLIFATQWPQYVQTHLGRHLAGLDELIIVAPFVTVLCAGYLALYPLDRMIREIMMGELLYLYEPVRPIWTRGQYLSFQLRFQVLLVAAPLMLIVAAKDLVDSGRPFFARIGAKLLTPLKLGDFADLSGEMVLAAVAGAVILFSPLLIRMIWYCRPLPPGPLREKLHALARQANLRYRNILLWPTYGIIVNAAVMGLFGRLRYIILSDGLIESMTDGQIEGVFGHEVGHVRHHHLQFLLLFAFASMGLLGLGVWQAQLAWHFSPNLAEGILFVAVFTVWLFLFGRLSRSFERQADLYAVEQLSLRFDEDPTCCGYPGCPRHRPGATASLGSDEPLCLAAAELVCAALHRAASLNAIPRSAKSWRHGSIHARCETIMRMTADPEALAAYRLHMTLVKFGIILAVAATIVAAFASLDTLRQLAASGQLAP